MPRNAEQDRGNQPQGIPIEASKVAVYWRVGLYFLSAAMMGKALADLSSFAAGESLGNVGMALIFAELAFRSKEAAILAYVRDPKIRNKAMIQTRQSELKNRPYVTWILRTGWIILAIGVGQEVSAWF